MNELPRSIPVPDVINYIHAHYGQEAGGWLPKSYVPSVVRMLTGVQNSDKQTVRKYVDVVDNEDQNKNSFLPEAIGLLTTLLDQDQSTQAIAQYGLATYFKVFHVAPHGFFRVASALRDILSPEEFSKLERPDTVASIHKPEIQEYCSTATKEFLEENNLDSPELFLSDADQAVMLTIDEFLSKVLSSPTRYDFYKRRLELLDIYPYVISILRHYCLLTLSKELSAQVDQDSLNKLIHRFCLDGQDHSAEPALVPKRIYEDNVVYRALQRYVGKSKHRKEIQTYLEELIALNEKFGLQPFTQIV